MPGAGKEKDEKTEDKKGAEEKGDKRQAETRHEDDNIGPGDEKKGVAAVGWQMPCKCGVLAGEYKEAEITFRQINRVSGKVEYYVHFEEYNKRLDEWVHGDSLDFTKVKRAEDQKDKKKEPGTKKRKKKKKKTEKDDPEGDEGEEVEAAGSGGGSGGGHGGGNSDAHGHGNDRKMVQRVYLGKFSMDTWYYSPFPPEYEGYHELWFCEYTLRFFRSRDGWLRHHARNTQRHPPGDEIYRKDNISMFEVDGSKHKIWCQNLCYLAKLFLDHKTLFYDVDVFFFYVMCEVDELGYHIVGYFSKEKVSEEGFNLACICSLPCHQRKGYGNFLIQFSYELSKKEERVGTPERPLSDLGLLAYRSYWTKVVVKLFKEYESLSIQEITALTYIRTDDVISTLQTLNLIRYHEGQHIIDLSSAPPQLLNPKPFTIICDPKCLRWTPHSMGKGALHMHPSEKKEFYA